MWRGGSHSIISSWATSTGPFTGTPGLLFLTVIHPVMRHPHQLGVKAPALGVVLPMRVGIIHDDRIYRNAGRYQSSRVLPTSPIISRGAADAISRVLRVQYPLVSSPLFRSYPLTF